MMSRPGAARCFLGTFLGTCVVSLTMLPKRTSAKQGCTNVGAETGNFAFVFVKQTQNDAKWLPELGSQTGCFAGDLDV